MSKIIVDQIQKNGGDVLTLPTTDATANNQPLVGSTTGVLSHSPLALPAADGSANRPMTTDGSAQLQFGAFSLPTGTGSSGQTLASDGSGGTSWADAPESLPAHTDSANVIGTVISSTGQENSYSSGDWSSSGPWTTYRHDNFFSDNQSYIQGWNMFMGDGRPATTSTSAGFYVNNTDRDMHRMKQYAFNQRLGYYYRDSYYNDNETSYGGLTWRCLPIRNGGASDVTVPINGVAASYTTYNGCSLGYFTPTNSSGTAYSTVTGGSWTGIASNNGGTEYNMTGNITVPAGKTVLVFLNSAKAYKTTYRFLDTNFFYSLDQTFSNSDIYCDLRMLETLAIGRCTHASQTGGSTFYIYNHCANLWGDR